MKTLISKLGEKKFPGSNTATGKSYHSFNGFDGTSHAGNVQQRVDLILKHINPNGLYGMDLGCNIGGITLNLARAGAKMFGIDYDYQSIEVARFYADKFYQNINYYVGDIDLDIIKSGAAALPWDNDDFIVWFSQWQWFCKQHGFETGLEALFEIGKKDTILFFETALSGDGMAGSVMKANGITEDKMKNILENCFTKVEKIGVDENWRKRPIFKCEGNKPFEYNGHKDNTIKRVGYNQVLKIQLPQYGFNQYDREKNSLLRFYNQLNKHFPLISSFLNVDNEIVMSYEGEPLKKLPGNWKEQAEEILQALKEVNLVHRDIIPRNLLIKEGIIKLIDFSWSGSPDEDTSNFPGKLGTNFKGPDGFDNRYSLYKSLEAIDDNVYC